MASDIYERLTACQGFDWDEGNLAKISERHAVSQSECEQVFFSDPLLVAPDVAHSRSGEGWAAWGMTLDGRRLTVVFTLRGDRVRPISARDMSRKERKRYAEVEAQDQADT